MKKKITGLLLVLLFLSFPAWAKDYMVTYMGEMYKEMPGEINRQPMFYHALQVDTQNGSRLLILTGGDSVYRNWLRQYMAHENNLIVQVPDSDDDQFMHSRVFEVDVTAVHPVWGDIWQEKVEGLGPIPPFLGDKHILVVDPDNRRRELVEMVVKNLGYPVTVTENGEDALAMFTRQPDKFRMVITDSQPEELAGLEMVTSLIKVTPDLPVIFGTGYKRNIKDLSRAFNGSDKVIVTQLLLSELAKNIHRLLET